MVAVVWRIVRVALAMAGTAFLGSIMNAPQLIALTPFISGAFKALREKYPNLWWLPL